MPARPRTRFALVFAVALALVLPACGGGGASAPLPPPETEPGGLAITTASLPGGSVGTPFTSTLSAANAQGPLAWSLSSGSLPGGLTLATDGTISGTPTADGLFPFTVGVTDGVGSDTQALSINIGSLNLTVTAGLTFGDAWTNSAVSLSTGGQTGTVAFSVVTNESGGSLSNENGAAGTATWTPGPTGGVDVSDRIRATDTGNGQSFDVDIDVLPNPVGSHVAGFGSSDVWWVDTSTKDGTHNYTSDYHMALVDVGLRSPASTGPTGTEADDIAALWLRVELLRELNTMFLRNRDGSEGTGLAITFPFMEPGAGYTKPAAASTLGGSPTRYSQMAVAHGTQSGVIGTAFLDGTNNNSHENDTTAGSLELGVFPNQISPIFNSAYSNTLDNNPITDADVEALKALLYEQPSPGGRYNLIRDIGRGYARTLAAVFAHEIGHSLGLDHTSPSQPGSIMNPSALISPSATYAFTSADVSTLQGGLPGAGKGTGSQTASQKTSTPAPVPEGGVRVCRCRACTTGPQGR